MTKTIFIILSVLFSIVVLIFIISSIANNFFNQKVDKEIGKFLDTNISGDKKIVDKRDLEGLPGCVQRWLKYSEVIGKEKIRSVRLKQRAKMRLEKKKSWMPVEAKQYFTIDKPGFIWKAKIKAAPFVHIVGKDKYNNGRGSMLIKLLSLITVVDEKENDKIDQGTLLRFLGESVWFPTAALNEYIKWEEIDSNTARATMSYGGVTASGTFLFKDNGEVLSFTAKRYRESNGEYTKATWTIPIIEYKEINDIKIPTKGEVIWKLKDGDFNWYNFEITDIEYNTPKVYK